MKLRTTSKSTLAAVAASALAASSSAQGFNNQWVEFVKATNQPDLETASSIDDETDLAWDDLDNDGDVDLVVVRKEPFTSAGRRTNLLYINEDGILVDKTDEFATASDVTGDEGFNTETNDRDVVIGDVNLDGWMDIITATTLSDGEPKHIGHPRVYINLGEDGSGNWQGFEYQDARVPQFFSYSTGQPENPRFCSVAVGDVTGDGYPDLNDRLLVNDGTGHFSDESQSRMTSEMLLSAFGNSVEIRDFNLDGANDILKDTALNFPQRVSVSYNNVANEGNFNIFDPFHTFAPYHTSAGDLNNDGRLDVLVSDDGSDRIRYNLENDILGRVVWGQALTFAFLAGGDDGFGSNNLIADLDGDGWNDALVADVDVDIGGYNRRLHVYHNPGGNVGDQIQLIEERESSSNNGWLGAPGLYANELRGTHDIAVFDSDGDLDNDLIISNSRGTFLMENQAHICQIDEGGSSGDANLKVCGKGLATGEESTLVINGAPNESVLVIYSTTEGSVPYLDGTLVPIPVLGFIQATTDANGEFTATVPGGGVPVDVFVQAILTDPLAQFGLSLTQAVRLEFQP